MACPWDRRAASSNELRCDVDARHREVLGREPAAVAAEPAPHVERRAAGPALEQTFGLPRHQGGVRQVGVEGVVLLEEQRVPEPSRDPARPVGPVGIQTIEQLQELVVSGHPHVWLLPQRPLESVPTKASP